MHVYMLVEKRYPLTPATIIDMLNKKLKSDYWNEIFSAAGTKVTTVGVKVTTASRLQLLEEFMLTEKRSKTYQRKDKDCLCDNCFGFIQYNLGLYKLSKIYSIGINKRAGIDFNEVFSLVVRHTSIRVILALTACKDYELEQLDVKTAFLHGNLEEVIYMRQPPGYEQGNKVNDMLIACKSKAKIGSTKSLHKKEFDMKELEEAKKILGMEIMSLGGHFKQLLKDFPIRDCDVKRMSKVSYENEVGSLMYLMVCTRPDIAYVDPDKGRSITGYAFLVQGCVVSWKVTIQHMVALSTTETECMALTEVVKEAIWLRGLLEELGVELNTVAVNYDN
ncbi:retrotransposon protein, putative, ty1-copia subclass [Tanacetum coccineum]